VNEINRDLGNAEEYNNTTVIVSDIIQIVFLYSVCSMKGLLR
jgi:hypothetical protein